jgi:hypothetical protein
MYLLHLLQPCGAGPRQADQPDAACLWCAAVTSGTRAVAEHRVLLLGGAPAAARAQALGVVPALGLAPPLGFLPAARAGLRRTLATWGRPLALHAWSTSLAPLALHAAGLCGVPALITDVVRGTITLHTTHPGHAATSTLPLPTQALPVPALQTRRDIRESLRVAEDEVVLCAADDPPGAVSVRKLCEAASILHVAGVRITLLASSLTPGLHVLHRHATGGYLRRLLVSDQPIASLTAAVDLAVLTSTWCFASGVMLDLMAGAGACVVASDAQERHPHAFAATSARGSHLASACIDALDTAHHTLPSVPPPIDAAFWRTLWAGQLPTGTPPDAHQPVTQPPHGRSVA